MESIASNGLRALCLSTAAGAVAGAAIGKLVGHACSYFLFPDIHDAARALAEPRDSFPEWPEFQKRIERPCIIGGAVGGAIAGLATGIALHVLAGVVFNGEP